MKTYEARFSVTHDEGHDLFFYRHDDYDTVTKFVNRVVRAKNFKELWNVEHGELAGDPCIFELKMKKIFQH